jgi:hypothetical protein
MRRESRRAGISSGDAQSWGQAQEHRTDLAECRRVLGDRLARTAWRQVTCNEE